MLRAFSFLSTAALLLGPSLAAEPLDAQEILRRAVEQAERRSQQEYRSKHEFRILAVSEKLNKKGEIKKTEQNLYRSFPIEGFPFEQLIEKDGRPLSQKQSKKERKKEEKFREKLAKGKTPKDPTEERRVAFNGELVERWDFFSMPDEQVGDRDCYVLSFRPKSGDLPQRRRIDRALNKSSGILWIERGSYEVVRAEFSLKDKVKLWGGLIGNISDLQGQIEREQLDDGTWAPSRFSLYLKGRVFFKSLHMRQKISWSDFKPIESAILSSQSEDH